MHIKAQVMSAEANYVRVNVESLDNLSASVAPPKAQLLCTVRAVLKKIKQRVLVGDKVRVSSIDWREGRAVVDQVFQRSSVLQDPAIANVDHVLLVFALAQPPVSANSAAATAMRRECVCSWSYKHVPARHDAA